MSTYRLVRKLGSTALVESWAAVELTTAGAPTRRVVVLKRLLAPVANPAALSQAVERGAALGGDGTVPVVELGQARGSAVLVEENVEGESLRGLLTTLAAQKGRLAPNEGFAVLLQVLGAVAELHAAEPPVMHGDVGPATTFLTPGGDVRLAETGVASALVAGPGGPARAEAHALSVDQLSPGATAAADIFRLGLLFHELALGRALFSATDMAQGVAQVRAFTGLTTAALPSVPEPFATLLTRLLALDPAQRPSARDTQMLLEQATRRLGWAVGPPVVAALYARAFPTRPQLSALWNAPGDDLVLLPLGALHEPVARTLGVTEAPAPAPAPAPVFSPPPQPLVPPVAARMTPVPPVAARMTPVPGTAAIPEAPFASASSQVGLGRISTKRVSLTELKTLQALDAPPVEAPVPVSSPSGGIKDFRVGQHLVTQGKVTKEKLEEAVAYARDFGASLPDALLSVGAVDEDDLVGAVGEVTRTPTISGKRLDDMAPMTEALQLIGPDDANRLCLVPLSLKGSTQIVVAVKDPMDDALVQGVKALTGLSSVVAIRAGERAIRRTIARFYGVEESVSLPSWMDPSPSAPITSSPSPSPRSAARAIEIPAEGPAAPPRRKTLFPAAPPSTPGRPQTLAPTGGETRDAARVLLAALLGFMGPAGKQARTMLEVVSAVGRRVGLKDSEQSRVWLAAAAVVVTNLGGGRRPCDLGQASLASALLGPAYLEIEPLLSPVTDARKPPISYLPSAVLLTTFTVAAAVEECPPSPVLALPVVESLRPRVPAPVLDAMIAELESL